MDKIRFGKTELRVGRIALGGIPIQRLSLSEAARVVRGVVDMGVNFIDTANGYTDSEEKIGLAVKDVPRESLVIATKSSARDKKTFSENIDLSLSRLGTDYIDLYQIHDLSSAEAYESVFGEGGAYEALEEAVRAGKVRFPAFSSHNIPLSVKIMREGKFAAVQLPFNYIDDEAATEAVPLAKETDTGFIAMKPFGGGLLSDAKLSVKYLLQYDNIVPDPGIEKLSEMEEIIRIVDSGEMFSADDAKAAEKLKRESGGNWCHRCDYCKPCPQNIMISGILTMESFFRRMPRGRVAAMLGKSVEAARGCTQCRSCAQKCPYNLDIPELIKEKLTVWDRYMSRDAG